MTGPLVGLLFGADYAAKAFSDPARLQGMLDFEAALARAEATVGLIPQTATTAIATQCRAELFDIGALATAAVQAGNPAIPMVKALTALVGQGDPSAARFVHWGATSQDAMDTGLVLQLRGFLDVFATDLGRLATVLAALATKHKATPMTGRTWLQHAVPVTFGLKAAGWLDAVTRHRARLAEIRPRALALQLGGAAGTLAAFGGRGLDVAAALSRDLDLPLPATPWHSQRDRIAEIGAFLGLVVGTLGKIARDLSLLMQTDVAEAFEPAGEGRGGSSTMPHKRNPVASAVVLAAAVRAPGMVATLLSAMVQDHERGLGGWHAEWETLPELAVLAAGALRHTSDAMAGLDVDPNRMRRNLDTTHGLIFAEAVAMALAPAIGRSEAHALLERACRRAADTKRHLKAVLTDDAAVTAHLKPADLDRLFDPANAVGEAQALVERVLREHR